MPVPYLWSRLTLPSRGRPQAGSAHLRPPLMSNVRALKCEARERESRVVHQPTVACNESFFRRLFRAAAHLAVESGSFRIIGVPREVSRKWHHVLARSGQAAMSVSCWRFAPPRCAGQSVSESEALLRFGQLTSSSTKPAGVMLVFSKAASEVRLMSVIAQRPNPSIEGTCNGEPHWFASARSVTPSHAPHVKR